MSFSSFFAGLSGLQANSSSLSVIGNNLANVNTIAFKSSRVTFTDFFDGAGFDGAGNPAQVGRGTSLASIDPVFTQGSLQTTSLLTDMAIQGRGYFVVGNGQGERFFTRAGNFGFDSDGNMVNASGRFVQGFTTRDADGKILASGSLANIQIPTGILAEPQQTASFNTVLNLDASYEEDFTTTLTVYDSLGTRHDLTVQFQPDDSDSDGTFDSWTYEVSAPGEDVAGGTAGTPSVLATGSVSFDSSGQLVAPAGDVTINVAGWSNGAAAQTLTWELYDAQGRGRLTGFDSPSQISSSSQDGFGPGELRTLTIDQEGLVAGIFSNGVTVELARVAIASFNSEQGLLRVGKNTFVATNSSGNATIGAANSGGRGATISGALELSNVDITKEFTDLIISQRGYQANSRIITTTDEVIQEALSIKR